MVALARYGQAEICRSLKQRKGGSWKGNSFCLDLPRLTRANGDVNNIINPGRDRGYIFGKVTGEFASAAAEYGGITNAHVDNGLSPPVKRTESGDGLMVSAILHGNLENVSVFGKHLVALVVQLLYFCQ